jgi:predicted phage terminase large subunit-like protein
LNEVFGLAAVDLACYAVALWPGFQMARHHELIIEKLEAVTRGDIRRLMIFMPPRHGKSLITTQLFPAWYLGLNPRRSVISSSYGQELSDDFGRRVRGFVTDPLHQAIFPECRIAEDSSSMRRFNTVAGGSYYAVGRGGPITGRGADLLIIDDPLKDFEEAQSEAIREGLHQWYSSVAYTRLQPGGAVVLIQTRWHEDDLAGRLLREQRGEWHVVSLPAIAESDEPFRKAGESLWPERFPLPELQRIRTSVGSSTWAALYQQRPSAAEGTVFKREWWHYYGPLPSLFTRIVQSWDTAFKKGAENDFSVCTTWGVTPTGFYLLHAWRGRVEFPELKRIADILAAQWRPSAILVEDKASGQSLIQELKVANRLPILPVKVDSDKLARAAAVTPTVEAGKVFLPESAPWLDDYRDEMASFPTGVYDDYVDSTTQALNYLRASPGGVFEWMRLEVERIGLR